jgi:hypothetical protein
MLRRAIFALLLGSVSRAPSSTGARMIVAAPDTLGRFPSVEGSNLEGEHFTLPADFKGELNVVLVAFKREQQTDVDSWMPFLKTVGESRRALRVYELPTLGRRYRLMRPFIDGGMRRGIADAAVRAVTITLYIDKAPFRESLRLPDEDRISVLLVDQKGRLFWRAEGRFDERMGTELVRRIDEARSANGAGG